MDDILDGLNERQKEAVTSTEGYVRIIAGAGSGKTKTLTHRYSFLVEELGISTENILCVTFTNKAANEMKKRIRDMIGDNDTGYICTFHGFCLHMLKEDIHVLNYPKNFIVLDTDDTESIFKNIYETCNIKASEYPIDMAKKDIHNFKMTRDDEDNYKYITWLATLDLEKIKSAYLMATDRKKKVILGYLYEQRKCYALDFDDLIYMALYVLKNYEEKREKWQRKMMYVMVDEFQDVSTANYELAEILSGYHKNLFIVGDPDQTIYTWRGAKVDYILDFDKEHDNTKTIIMDTNYRSTPNILNASNSLIRKNKKRIEKELLSTKQGKMPTTYFHAKSTKQEAAWIAEQIKEIVEKGKKYSDIAVLYRSHYVSRSIEEAFINEGIQYILYSGIEFYKRKEIKDILAYLRMLLYEDDISFLRVINVPKRNFGEKRISFLKEYAESHKCSLYAALKENMEYKLIATTRANEFVDIIEKYRKDYQNMNISDVIAGILSETGYEEKLKQLGEDERLENISELKQSVFDFEKNSGEDNLLEDYLQNIALFTNSDREESKDGVKLMTIHTAKGLEFPCVFVCGMNEGIFPSMRVDSIERMEEERRIAYVAYTRAEEMLFLSDAEGYNYDGCFRCPSRFIFDIDKAYVNYIVDLDDELVRQSEKYIRKNERKMERKTDSEKSIAGFIKFKVGDTVRHKFFGIGKVIEIREDHFSYTIKFENSETERNLNFRVKLEKVNT